MAAISGVHPPFFVPISLVIRAFNDVLDIESANRFLDGDIWFFGFILGSITILIGCVGMSISAGLGLVCRHVPSSVVIAKRSIWLSSLSGNAFVYLFLVLRLHLSVAAFAFTAIQPLVFATIWTLYLTRSRRVRRTYGVALQSPGSVATERGWR